MWNINQHATISYLRPAPACGSDAAYTYELFPMLLNAAGGSRSIINTLQSITDK